MAAVPVLWGTVQPPPRHQSPQHGAQASSGLASAPAVGHAVDVFVGGIKQATAGQLRAVFEEFGHVTDIMIPQDFRSKRSRGFAYISLIANGPVRLGKWVPPGWSSHIDVKHRVQQHLQQPPPTPAATSSCGPVTTLAGLTRICDIVCHDGAVVPLCAVPGTSPAQCVLAGTSSGTSSSCNDTTSTPPVSTRCLHPGDIVTCAGRWHESTAGTTTQRAWICSEIAKLA